MPLSPLTQRWKDLPVAKKLYAVVGLMAILIASELFTLLFAMSTLSSVRAFVVGEGLWTKSQKDAIHSLYQYALHADERHYRDFQAALRIPEGDRAARLELMKPDFDRDKVRAGFLQGENHPSDIDGMIDLLTRFHDVRFIRDAVAAWVRADVLLLELQNIATQIHLEVLQEGRSSPRTTALLDRVAEINAQLTQEEILFSSSLGAGSRWLENLLLWVLTITVLTVEGTGLFLTWAFSRGLNRNLRELQETAMAVGRGDFGKMAPVHSADELGQLAVALNAMAAKLQATHESLRRMNDELEERVRQRSGEVQRREEQLRLITAAMPVLLAELDTEENFLFSNESYRRQIGETEGKTLRQVVGEARYEAIRDQVRAVLKEGRTVTYERHAEDGTIQTVTMVPEWGPGGKPKGLIFVATDVTNYKRIEAELKEAKLTADAASATKSAFLANMSHELRTPLGAVLGFSELLLDDDMTASEKASYVEIIKRNGALLSTLINDILDLSKVEAGKLEIERTPVDFRALAEELRAVLALKAEAKGIGFDMRVAPDNPENGRTDAFRLRQVLLNIVGNAIKFTDEGRVEVDVRRVGGNLVSFRVSDTGRGIPPEHAEKLFTAFTQADASTTRRFGGTGLGLALSKRLATALGGDVRLVSSSPGEGSVFEVTVDAGAGEPLAPAASSDAAPPRLDETKVLLVEDSADNRAIIAYFLRGAGATVETADNGKEGVRMALDGDYAMVLMDLQMPVMDGTTAVKELRSRGYRRPVVALTAHAMVDDKRRCLESGFDDHLSKPVDRDLLLRTIAHLATS